MVTNNTVKVPAGLQRRIENAMKVEGFTVWSEFCRVALTEKCHQTEDQLRTRDPEEYKRIYSEPKSPVAVRRKKSPGGG